MRNLLKLCFYLYAWAQLQWNSIANIITMACLQRRYYAVESLLYIFWAQNQKVNERIYYFIQWEFWQIYSYSKFLSEEQKRGEVFQLHLQVVRFGKEKENIG